MYLSEQIYTLVRNELVTAGITAYSDCIPDDEEIIYPFCLYEIINPDNKPDIAFNKDYEHLIVKFNIYGNKDNQQDIVDLAEQIEDIFNRTKKAFVNTDNGKYLVANFKENDDITFLEEDSYWLATTTYAFCAQRTI